MKWIKKKAEKNCKSFENSGKKKRKILAFARDTEEEEKKKEKCKRTTYRIAVTFDSFLLHLFTFEWLQQMREWW